MRRRFWITVAVVIIILIVFMFGGDGLWDSVTLRKKVSSLEAQVDSLKTINQQMERKIEGLKENDPSILEEEARSHGMIKPGEKVYILKQKEEQGK